MAYQTGRVFPLFSRFLELQTISPTFGKTNNSIDYDHFTNLTFEKQKGAKTYFPKKCFPVKSIGFESVALYY